jgi:hypothetical protein
VFPELAIVQEPDVGRACLDALQNGSARIGDQSDGARPATFNAQETWRIVAAAQLLHPREYFRRNGAFQGILARSLRLVLARAWFIYPAMTELERAILQALRQLETEINSARARQASPDLLPLFKRLDEIAQQLPQADNAALLHYLNRKSYAKARAWLEEKLARTAAAEPPPGP